VSLELILKDIDDPYIQENFSRLRRFIDDQPILAGNWQFFQLDIPSAQADLRFQHKLGFRPKDVIVLSVDGDKRVDFRFDLFTKDFIFLSTQGAACIRFLLGSYDQEGFISRLRDLTQVPATVSPITGGSVITGSLILPANTVTDVDVQALTAVKCLDYQICLRRQAGTQTKFFRFAVANGAAGLFDSVYAKIGDPLNVGISAQSSGGSYFARFTNNEAFNVLLEFSRIT